jgi:hypothetical protein
MLEKLLTILIYLKMNKTINNNKPNNLNIKFKPKTSNIINNLM